MRFFETILFAAGLVAAVTIDDYPTGGVVAGQTYTIKYSPADGGPTTFLLRQGESTDLTTIDTLTTTATGGSFQWTPSTDLVNEPNYALQVLQGSENNYSGLFSLTGGSEEAATSSAPSYSASTPASSMMTSSAASSAASAASSAISSIESSVSSVLASITSAAASASITPSAGLNSTVTSATLSKSTSASATTTKLPEVSTAAGNSLAQPMVAMLGAAAAFAYLA